MKILASKSLFMEVFVHCNGELEIFLIEKITISSSQIIFSSVIFFLQYLKNRESTLEFDSTFFCENYFENQLWSLILFFFF